MTQQKRGRPRKEQVSKEAEELFPDYVPAEERANKLEHDVDDLFADIDDTDLTSNHEKQRRVTEYAKKNDVHLNKPVTDEINAVPHKTITSPNLKDNESLNDLIRAEEIAADIVKTKGRFIEGVDNAKPGVTFRGPDASINPVLLNELEGIEYNTPVNPNQFIEKPKRDMRADGITLKGVLDTGIGAQEASPTVNERDDPASPNFMVCVNQECRYREHCLRYRLKSERSMKASFYPEDCRRDGIYMNVEESDFTAYPPFNVLESKSTPSF